MSSDTRVDVPSNICIRDRGRLEVFAAGNGLDMSRKWWVYFDYRRNCYVMVQDQEAGACDVAETA